AQAGHHLLTVRAEHLQPDEDEPLPTILALLSRIRSLTLAHSLHSNITGFEEQWTVPAPFLEELVTTRIAFPRNLLGGSAPCLHTFHLSLGYADWQTFPVCPYLQVLEIHEPQDPAISILTLLPILRNSPLLRKLVIEAVIDNSNPPDECVALCALEEISLLGWTARVLDPLDHITFPAHARVQIRMASDDAETTHIDLFETLQQCRDEASWSLTSLSVFCGVVGDSWTYGGGLTLEIPRERDGELSPMPHELQFMWIPEPLVRAMEILEHLSLDLLQVLDLNGARKPGVNETYPVQPFWTMIAALPRLQSLRIRNFYASEFLLYWTEDTLRKAYDNTVDKPFRSLLHVEYEASPSESLTLRAYALATRLKYMAQQNPSLTRLTVISGSAEGSWVNVLRWAVHTVEVRTN
ncbi:hypothetical protein BDN72DRAFT_846868, partial [Pluteus cervinus]